MLLVGVTAGWLAIGSGFAWLGFSVVVLLFWMGLLADPLRRWPREQCLPHSPPEADPPKVAVIVPARDEAEVIERTLRSLCAQTLRPASILVVDDGSSDSTAKLVLEVASEAPEVALLASTPRPAGWSGKLWALAQGVAWVERETTDVEWLLITDADIEHRPGSLASLLRQSRAEVSRETSFDMVSVMARLRVESFWECLIVPAFVWFFQLLYPFRAVADSASRVAAAAGGCVLIKPSALAAAGGYEAIRGALIDDVALARAVKSAGRRIWLGLDGGITSVRAYRTLGPLWRMISRNAFVELRYSYVRLVGVVLGLLLFFSSPPLLVAIGTAGVLAGSGLVGWGVVGCAATAWGLSASALLPSVRHHHLPGGWSMVLPLVSGLYAAMTVHSALNHLRGRTSTWRGRTY